jgi:hypothetical protein
MVTAPPTTTNAVARPALESGPTRRDEQNDDRERDRDTGDVEDVAESIVRGRLVERVRLLGNGDEHHTSGVASSVTKLLRRIAAVNRASVW